MAVSGMGTGMHRKVRLEVVPGLFRAIEVRDGRIVSQRSYDCYYTPR